MKTIDILLIEDNPTDVLLAKEAVASCHHLINIFVARDGLEGLAYLKKEGSFTKAQLPSLILLDLNLPRMGGLEFLQTLRRHPRLSYLPVLVMSTSTDQREVNRCYAAGATGYIPKPVDFNEFVSIMQGIEKFWFDTCILPNPRSKRSAFSMRSPF
jgi:chemotaxis family two-component system response regulator Rcp1